jgi:iron complex outermembrane recepter protein
MGIYMKKRFIVTASVFTALCSAGYAVGAEGDGPPTYDSAKSGSPDVLREIVVTAQKREEALKDVPISIVAIGGDELDKRQITSVEDLPSAVPDLAISNAGNSHYLEIRGISNIVGTSSLIGMYIDDSDVTLGGSATMQINPVTYDLERVEVLRGPQGTLYGDGSAGGTIRLITKNPDLNQFAFDSQVTAMFTKDGAPSDRVNAMLNVPLLDGTLGLRIASTTEHDGGWIDQPAIDRKNINEQDLTNVRIKALWQPSSELSVSAMAIVNRNERGFDFSDNGAPGQFTQVFGQSTTPRVQNDYNLYSATVDYDFSSIARISNTASYLQADAPQYYVPAVFQQLPPGTPDSIYDYYVPFQDITDRLLTDELRLTSTSEGPWRWTLGGFYRHYSDDVDAPNNYYAVAGPTIEPSESYASATHLVSKSWSAFADTSYVLWDRLTVGAGIRSFQETQNFSDDVAETFQTGEFHSVDPRFYVQLKVNSSVNVYASAAKGFRSGGYNAAGQPSYNPENVWTYEFGTKTSSPDKRLDIDADIFLTNYSNYQTFAPLSVAGELTSVIQDVGRARIKGVEANANWRPLDGWSMNVRGDYLNGRFVEIDATSIAYLPGDPIDEVPRYQFGASVERAFSWLTKSGSVRLDYSQQGPETYRNRSSGSWYYGESDVIKMLNLDTSIAWRENLTFRAFAHNLLDDRGFTNPFALISNGVRSRPLTVGVGFGVSFR